MGESILGIETNRKVDVQKFQSRFIYFYVKDYGLHWMKRGECATRISLNRNFLL